MRKIHVDVASFLVRPSSGKTQKLFDDIVNDQLTRDDNTDMNNACPSPREKVGETTRRVNGANDIGKGTVFRSWLCGSGNLGR